MTNSILILTFSYEPCDSNVEMAGCIHYFSKLIQSSAGKQMTWEDFRIHLLHTIISTFFPLVQQFNTKTGNSWPYLKATCLQVNVSDCKLFISLGRRCPKWKVVRQKEFSTEVGRVHRQIEQSGFFYVWARRRAQPWSAIHLIWRACRFMTWRPLQK